MDVSIHDVRPVLVKIKVQWFLIMTQQYGLEVTHLLVVGQISQWFRIHLMQESLLFGYAIWTI